MLAALLLASCHPKLEPEPDQTDWGIPLSAKDSDRVCLEVLGYPRYLCRPVSEVRWYFASTTRVQK